jgi:predicted GTPase
MNSLDEIFDSINTVRVGIFGCTSVGKSTILKCLFGDDYMPSHYKRCTMIPQIYREVLNDKLINLNDNAKTNDVRKKSEIANKIIFDKSNRGDKIEMKDIVPIEHQIKSSNDFFKSSDFIMPTTLEFVDIPGLDDSKLKNIYFEWVKQQFKTFDVVLFVTSVDHGLNTISEIEILDMILDCIAKNQERSVIMIPIINKCDDIIYEGTEYVFNDEQQRDMFQYAQKTYTEKINKKNLQGELLTKLIPFTASLSFVYNHMNENGIEYSLDNLDMDHINTIGVHELGKKNWMMTKDEEKRKKLKKIILDDTIKVSLELTGFKNFRETLRNKIINNEKTFCANKLSALIDRKDLFEYDFHVQVKPFSEYKYDFPSSSKNAISDIGPTLFIGNFDSSSNSFIEGKLLMNILSRFVNGVNDLSNAYKMNENILNDNVFTDILKKILDKYYLHSVSMIRKLNKERQKDLNDRKIFLLYIDLGNSYINSLNMLLINLKKIRTHWIFRVLSQVNKEIEYFHDLMKKNIEKYISSYYFNEPKYNLVLLEKYFNVLDKNCAFDVLSKGLDRDYFISIEQKKIMKKALDFLSPDEKCDKGGNFIIKCLIKIKSAEEKKNDYLQININELKFICSLKFYLKDKHMLNNKYYLTLTYKLVKSCYKIMEELFFSTSFYVDGNKKLESKSVDNRKCGEIIHIINSKKYCNHELISFEMEIIDEIINNQLSNTHEDNKKKINNMKSSFMKEINYAFNYQVTEYLDERIFAFDNNSKNFICDPEHIYLICKGYWVFYENELMSGKLKKSDVINQCFKDFDIPIRFRKMCPSVRDNLFEKSSNLENIINANDDINSTDILKNNILKTVPSINKNMLSYLEEYVNSETQMMVPQEITNTDDLNNFILTSDDDNSEPDDSGDELYMKNNKFTQLLTKVVSEIKSDLNDQDDVENENVRSDVKKKKYTMPLLIDDTSDNRDDEFRFGSIGGKTSVKYTIDDCDQIEKDYSQLSDSEISGTSSH